MHILTENTGFKPLHAVKIAPRTQDLLFIYQGGQIALNADSKLPLWVDLQTAVDGQALYCFGQIAEQRCFLLAEPHITSSLTYQDVKSCYRVLPTALYQAMAYGLHIRQWRQAHQYCGLCGTLMEDKAQERARQCPSCRHVAYPTIFPCVIMLVARGTELLLARSPHFTPGVFSTLAGFVEPGETAEQAVAREIQEEVNIQVSAIQYLASQPWPFSNSLMLGFIAEYAGGEIQIDGQEIEAAAWFARDQLPQLPSEISIARYLIEYWLQNR